MRKLIFKIFPRPLLIKISYWALPFLDFFYKGSTLTDPINGKSYRKFLSYGYEKGRKNAISPGTLSLERHRLMWLYLKNNTDFFSAKLKVLSIAPEQCFLKRFKSLESLEYITTDLYSPIVDVKADILNLPFDNNSFDVVFCNHVLEHIPDDAKAMSELYRILKPGGWGILQVPIKSGLEKTYEDLSITSPEERAKHFGQYDHVRWYGQDYFSKLKNTGFKVEKVRCTDLFSKEEITKYGLTENEILPVVKK